MSDTRTKGPLERFLSIFADVRGGEGLTAVLLTLNIFLVLTGYYMLKVVREPLILLGGAFGLEGAVFKAAASAGQAILLLGVIPAYGLLASRVNRVKLINTMLVIFIGSLVLFNVLAHIEVPLGLIFFIWLGIFNLMVIAQFWSFANDVYTEEQGKRIFAIVAFGGTAGAIVGAWLGGVLYQIIGPYQVMLGTAVVLVVCMVLTNVINHRESVAGGQKKKEEPLSKSGGFALVFRRKYLLLMALMILVYNSVNSNGEFILSQTVSEQAKEQALKAGGDAGKIIAGFYGDFFTWVNISTAVIQLFLVSRIFKYFGVRAALFVLPVISLGAYSTIALLPVLGVLKLAKILENSTDYSLQNTTRQALFLPTSREEKYKAKAAIDTFFVRFGDVAAFGMVYASTQVLNWTPKGVAGINIALVVVWLLFVIGIAREHRRLSEAEPPKS